MNYEETRFNPKRTGGCQFVYLRPIHPSRDFSKNVSYKEELETLIFSDF